MARYEKTVAGFDYVFAITIPTGSFVTVFSLLTTAQQSIVLGNAAEFNLLDGYVVSYQGPWQASRLHPGAGIETVMTNEKYCSPVEGWPTFVTCSASVPTAAIVRIFVCGG